MKTRHGRPIHRTDLSAARTRLCVRRCGTMETRPVIHRECRGRATRTRNAPAAHPRAHDTRGERDSMLETGLPETLAGPVAVAQTIMRKA